MMTLPSTKQFTIAALEEGGAVMTAENGETLRCPAALLPEGAAVGNPVWVSLSEPATPPSILNEILATDKNHGPS